MDGLEEAFVRSHLEIKPMVQDGKRGFYLELVGPQEVHSAVDAYCQRQGVDAETYLEDVGREIILKAIREARAEKN